MENIEQENYQKLLSEHEHSKKICEEKIEIYDELIEALVQNRGENNFSNMFIINVCSFLFAFDIF